MAKVFVSYSHKDADILDQYLDDMKNRGHRVDIDKSFLKPGDPINTEIKKRIIESDFILVFLSQWSAASKWVKQEVFESLHQELRTKRLNLIPCHIGRGDERKIEVGPS